MEQDITKIFSQSEVFRNQFTGFSLFDIQEQKFVAGYDDTKKFIPASNTKILTMYAVLRSFGDSLPSLLTEQTENELRVKPIGNPTFLWKETNDQWYRHLAASEKKITIVWPEKVIQSFGRGWAWDDYIYDYQAERSWWPIYGNQVKITKINDSIMITPPFFNDYIEVARGLRPGDLVDRELKYNLFKIYVENDTTDFERTIPFDYSKELFLKLLSDTIHADVAWSSTKLQHPDTLYSGQTDEVLSIMMKRSDNFLAEQLLILAAWKNGFDDIASFISHAKTHWFFDFNDFVWVDGSGLSRYNLIAPVDQVRLLKKTYDEYGWERIKNILAAGGEFGTIQDWYNGEEPFVYAKTGTLSNNHNLSGFIRVRSGKLMIFSFMNNHYIRPVNEIRLAMQKLLVEIRNAY